MGFKVIETEEELRAAYDAGMLWINSSTQWPRPKEGWEPCGWYEKKHACETWRKAKENSVAREAVVVSYLTEDFAVLVEGDACD